MQNQSLSKLKINISNIVKNYQALKNIVGESTQTAAVVKANCYGLGCEKIAPHLARVGCKEFYVATLDEAIALRKVLKAESIFVLSGINRGEEKLFIEDNLIPVLNNQHQIELWKNAASRKLKACLHIDTGMTRLGIEFDKVEKVLAELESHNLIEIVYILSHLACADNLSSEMNAAQLSKFNSIAKKYPQYQYSFANSAGVLLNKKEYFFDQVRPGIALYGCNPFNNHHNIISPVIELTSKIVQIYHIKEEASVGYNSTYKLKPGMVTATIPIGYADGYFRRLSNKGFCYINDVKVPIIGIISMDLISLDITAIPDHLKVIGQEVELIGKNISIETIATMADTISYEVLTSLGARPLREYILV